MVMQARSEPRWEARRNAATSHPGCEAGGSPCRGPRYRRARMTTPLRPAPSTDALLDESAVAKVTEARIYGYPVEALCGERFVPQQDPKKLPLCAPCSEIYELYRQVGDGGLSETPGS
jgi:hypothetical protein